MIKNEFLEECCDSLAMDIDERDGNITSDEVDRGISRAAEAAGVNRETFLQMFTHLYKCNPFVYVENAREDAAAGES